MRAIDADRLLTDNGLKPNAKRDTDWEERYDTVMLSDVADMIENAPTMPTFGTWYSVNGDVLPEQEQTVLVCYPDGYIQVAKYLGNGDFVDISREYVITYRPPTHWMPLPDAPKKINK